MLWAYIARYRSPKRACTVRAFEPSKVRCYCFVLASVRGAIKKYRVKNPAQMQYLQGFSAFYGCKLHFLFLFWRFVVNREGGGGRKDGRRAGVTPPTTRKTKRVVKFKGIWYNIHKIISLTASR